MSTNHNSLFLARIFVFAFDLSTTVHMRIHHTQKCTVYHCKIPTAKIKMAFVTHTTHTPCVNTLITFSALPDCLKRGH